MSRINVTSYAPQEPASSVVREDTIAYGFIGTLHRLKYQHRPDITDRATLEKNFREKFESLNRDRTYYFANNNARYIALQCRRPYNQHRFVFWRNRAQLGSITT